MLPGDTAPSEIFLNTETGELWQVIGVCREPFVEMRRLVRSDQVQVRHGQEIVIVDSEISGGIRGFMWENFVRMKEEK